jgi:hypothetical protein
MILAHRVRCSAGVFYEIPSLPSWTLGGLGYSDGIRYWDTDTELNRQLPFSGYAPCLTARLCEPTRPHLCS